MTKLVEKEMTMTTGKEVEKKETKDVAKKDKMSFSEWAKTPKGEFQLYVFCAVCWSFVTIMNAIDFDPSKKFDYILLGVDAFLAVFYLVYSFIYYRKWKKAEAEAEKAEVEIISE